MTKHTYTNFKLLIDEDIRKTKDGRGLFYKTYINDRLTNITAGKPSHGSVSFYINTPLKDPQPLHTKLYLPELDIIIWISKLKYSHQTYLLNALSNIYCDPRKRLKNKITLTRSALEPDVKAATITNSGVFNIKPYQKISTIDTDFGYKVDIQSFYDLLSLVLSKEIVRKNDFEGLKRTIIKYYVLVSLLNDTVSKVKLNVPKELLKIKSESMLRSFYQGRGTYIQQKEYDKRTFIPKDYDEFFKKHQ